MRHWVRTHLTYANVMVTILAFVVLGGGTAFAALVVSSNSQIGPGTVSGHAPPAGKHSNLILGSVNGSDVANNSLGGAKIRESSLGPVPNADALGGLSRERLPESGDRNLQRGPRDRNRRGQARRHGELHISGRVSDCDDAYERHLPG
jgi:hypothetical protein